jgi:hypothetical protein
MRAGLTIAATHTSRAGGDALYGALDRLNLLDRCMGVLDGHFCNHLTDLFTKRFKIL